jgi:hypothetical protein
MSFLLQNQRTRGQNRLCLGRLIPMGQLEASNVGKKEAANNT